MRVWLGMLVLSVACGGQSGEDAGSGVEPSKPLSKLTTEDGKALCSFMAQTARDALNETTDEGYCTLYTFGDDETRAACARVRDRCVLEGELARASMQDFGCDDVSNVLEQLADCEATVADYERCGRALATQRRDVANAADCDDPVIDLDLLLPLPDACEPLKMLCPDAVQ